ncbi:MAG: lactate 2-monooxygenase [Microbacteriaceae bacterium]|nr:lactate 2-monooxygenase [Microbacteriaceae bacterium]
MGETSSRGTSIRSTEAYGRTTQSAIYRDGATGRRPRIPSNWAALEVAAERAMSREAWAYVAGSAGNESTTAANRAALDRWRIVPRVLRDVADRDLSVELFGRRYPTPLLAAPVGVLGLVDDEADVAVGKAAASLGVPYIFSTQASKPMELVAAAMGDAPWWYQLYWSTSDELVASLVGRAEKAGAKAIVVTLDTHMLGWRPRDLDLGYLPFAHGMGIAQYTSDPVFLRLVDERIAAAIPSERPRITPATIRTLVDITRNYPGRFWANLRSPVPRASVDTFLDVFSRSNLTWQNLAFLRKQTSLPIVLKGIQHPDDAERAVKAGVDGVIVSNHAGRQIDDAIGSLDALPAIADVIAGRIPVLFDSGIRSGADAFVALALGATAVCVGRAYTYGLAVAGEAGAREALRNIVAELDIVLGLAGLNSVNAIDPTAVTRV